MFQDRYSLPDRVKEAVRMRVKYPDRIAIVIQKDPLSTLATLSQIKYLVPSTSTVGDIMMVVRKKIHLKPHQSLFFYVHDKVLSCSILLNSVYELNRDEDGFLYIYYKEENTFG
jgi:GABA(A) receptor-associated protein